MQLPGGIRVSHCYGVDELPAYFCHHDAHRRNLIDSVGAAGQSETDGLRDASWRGDQRLARFGCAFNAVVITGLFWNLYFLERAQADQGADVLSNMIGQPFDAIVQQYAELLPFLLELGAEAERLATVP